MLNKTEIKQFNWIISQIESAVIYWFIIICMIEILNKYEQLLLFYYYIIIY